MKKILFMALAAFAITVVSCTGGKTDKGDGVDSTLNDTVSMAEEDATAAAEEVISTLSSNIEAKDASALQATLEVVKARVAEFIATNPELAKEYLAKVQTYLKDNAEQINALAGGNEAVATLVQGLTNIPVETVEQLTGATDALKAIGIDTQAAVGDAAAAGAAAVDGAINDAKGAVNDAKEAAVKGAQDVKDQVTTKANDAVRDAKSQAGAAVDKAATKAANDVKRGLGL